ncbi:UNVERIFIED_CONTAM: hypothetical protein K2H54_055302, partial [Gekko kuhli]
MKKKARPGAEGVAGAAELASTMQGLREAFDQLSKRVDKMSQDMPAKRARTTEPPSTPPRQGRSAIRSPRGASGRKRRGSSTSSAGRHSSQPGVRSKARGHKEGRSRTSAGLRDESDAEDSSGEAGPAGQRKWPPSEYWVTAAHEPGLPAWAIHRRALTDRAGGDAGVVWDEVDVANPSSILSTYSNGEEPPGLHLSEELRDSILDGYYVNVFTLLQKWGTEARTLKHDKKEKKERSEEAERTFINWVSGYLVYAGVVATAYPERGWHLINHMSNVVEARVLAGEGAAIDYDETCRKLASRNERARWDLLQDKIWLQEVGPCIKGKSEVKPDRWSARKYRSRGVCWEYNQGRCRRARCKFSHACELCGGGTQEGLLHVGSGRAAALSERPAPLRQRQRKRGRGVLRHVSCNHFQTLAHPPCFWSLAVTPVRVAALRPLLAAYPLREAAQYILEGFTDGFRIPSGGPRVATDSDNL